MQSFFPSVTMATLPETCSPRENVGPYVLTLLRRTCNEHTVGVGPMIPTWSCKVPGTWIYVKTSERMLLTLNFFNRRLKLLFLSVFFVAVIQINYSLELKMIAVAYPAWDFHSPWWHCLLRKHWLCGNAPGLMNEDSRGAFQCFLCFLRTKVVRTGTET